MPTVVSEQQLIDRLKSAEVKLRRAAVNAVVASRNAPGTLQQVAQLIQSGRIEDAVQAAARAGAIEMSRASAAVYVQSGIATASQLSDVLDVTVDFDQVHDFAVDRIRQNRLLLVREWQQTQRDVARQVLEQGVERGLNPVEQARAFRASTGLTARQEQAVRNYRRLLERVQAGDTAALSRRLRDARFDRTVESAARLKRPLSRDKIDRMVNRYRERSIKRRAETIARTEALRSVNAGNFDAFRQAADEGVVPAQDFRRKWVAARDERVRPDHMTAAA